MTEQKTEGFTAKVQRLGDAGDNLATCVEHLLEARELYAENQNEETEGLLAGANDNLSVALAQFRKVYPNGDPEATARYWSDLIVQKELENLRAKVIDAAAHSAKLLGGANASLGHAINLYEAIVRLRKFEEAQK